jgi:hypothetical protein
MSVSAFHSELRSAMRDARAAQDAPTTAPRLLRQPPATIPPAPAPAAERSKRTVVRLWLPLTPLWVILAPFALALCPLLLFAPHTRGLNPYRVALALGGTLFALSGTYVDVESPDAVVLIRVI